MLVIAIVMLAFTIPAISADLQATIGGLNSSGEYHFTVDSDGVMDGASGSIINARIVGDIELITATEEVLTAADSGKLFIATATATTTFTLPSAVAGLEFGFSTSKGQTISVDPASTLDTILYLSLDGGDELDSAGATADSLKLRAIDADSWVPVDMGSSAWTDGGTS